MLQVDRRNRSVQFKKIFAKHNFDLVSLEEFNLGICEKISEKALKNTNTSLNFFLDSIDGDDSDIIRANLRHLSNNLRQIEDETGQQTGFIGFPFLQGHANSDFFVRGPLVLFPVSLEQKRQAKGGGWFLNFLNSRPIFNGALIAAIKKKAELKIPENIDEKFDELIDEIIDYDKSNIEEYFFKRITQWIKDIVPIDELKNNFNLQKIPSLTKKDIEDLPHEKFHLLNYKILGNFPQADNEIYKDYAKLLENSSSLNVGVLGDLLDVFNPDEEFQPDQVLEEIELDLVPDEKLNTVLDSDSSQDRVILESKRSDLVVVRGPPGTGKSQVITNLISDALTNNKKVLVVCQKRAALDVVHQRLGKVGLDRFVVVLDKEHEDRRKMYQQLYETIQDPGYYFEGTMTIDEVSRQINKRIRDLSELGKALHKPYFGGVTAQKLYGLSQSSYNPKLDLSWIGLSVEWNDLDDYLRKLHDVEPLFKKFELSPNPWSGRKDFSSFGLREKSEILKTIDSLKSILSESLVASTAEEQDELVHHFDRYLNNPGFLKRNQKSSAKRISEILSIPEVKENFIKSNFELINRGIDFWKPFATLLKLFSEKTQKELYILCKNPQELSSRLDSMKQSLSDYDLMQDYDKKLKEFDSSIEKILFACKDKLDSLDNWSEIIRQEIFAFWIDIIEKENPILKGNPIDEYNRNQESLAKLLEAKKTIVRNKIQSQIAGSISIADIAGRSQTPEKRAWKEFSAELKKKNRTKPVRQLFEKYTYNFLKIAPCWLASPESVSKVFPLQRNLFDLVIVDEASQLAVERALPFLYRAKSVVIAGDENQLQPFDLFQLKEDEEEDFDDEISEEKSLLDLANVRTHPIQLAWHYRSKYQDLINFSNHAFYNGLLQVAPNVRTDPTHPPIRWIQCNGMWDKRQNHEEALIVLDEITKLWKKHSKSGRYPSIGVITFNDEQRDLIQDQFDKKLDSDPEFQQLYSSAIEGKRKDDRPFFKNIENVQGDERDIIIFSIGYAKDLDGEFANRFGTLSKQGGQNRLNVAITRAREEMVVICSIEPNQIKETSKNNGPRLLRKFLEYSRASSQLNKEGVDEVLAQINENMVVSENNFLEFDSPFETQVYKALSKHGYVVHTQIGASEYKIDLGVLHPDDPHRYVLAIECDGATFHSSKSAKERDVMRQKFLENKGWKFERIWSRNWWRNSQIELDRIISRIKKELESESKTIKTELSSDKQKNDKHELKQDFKTSSDVLKSNFQSDEKINALSKNGQTDNEFYESEINDSKIKSTELNTEKINNCITDSLILIKNKRFGILQSEIQTILALSEREMSELIPRLLRLDNIYAEERIQNGIIVNRLLKLKRPEESQYAPLLISASDIEQYIASKNFSSSQTIQSQTSVLTNFSKLVKQFPNDTKDQIFRRFIEGKSNSSISFSKSVIYGLLEFKDSFSKNNFKISKEQARQELSLLPEKLTNQYITQEEYQKRRNELEKILFD